MGDEKDDIQGRERKKTAIKWERDKDRRGDRGIQRALKC